MSETLGYEPADFVVDDMVAAIDANDQTAKQEIDRTTGAIPDLNDKHFMKSS
eukprot:jgi/Psemu1/34602/gm1.34602_g